MADPGLTQRIEQVAAPLARAIHVDLVDVTCLGKGSGSVVRVTIDKADGVGIQDCEQLHHSLSRALDVMDSLSHAYRLEVSSPGLDRPLKTRQDFQRSLHKLIRLRVSTPMNGKDVLVGHVEDVHEEGIRLQERVRRRAKSSRASLTHDVPWAAIQAARLEVEF